MQQTQQLFEIILTGTFPIVIIVLNCKKNAFFEKKHEYFSFNYYNGLQSYI